MQYPRVFRLDPSQIGRIGFLLGIAVLIGIPGAMQVMSSRHGAACINVGNVAYEITSTASRADLRVQLIDEAQQPDMPVRLVDRPEQADFVLVDDVAPSDNCGDATQRRTVWVGDATPATAPNLTISVSRHGAPLHRTLYLESRRFSAPQAAALAAAIAWQRQTVAAREDSGPHH